MTARLDCCDLAVVTPSRKRKRQFASTEELKENDVQTTAALASCFTNAAFCSTPKKIVAKRRNQLNKTRDNNTVNPSACREANAITENEKDDANKTPQNPFEVLRRPPKKKKCHAEELACFENQALNLDVPEKLFNPYEVIREVPDNKNSNCFSNPALNLKINDASIVCNPFEVQRQTAFGESLNTEIETLCKNPFIISPETKGKLPTQTYPLKLGLPFPPKLGCRIDFKDISISELTPSKLLAEKLVFSPVQKPKLSLETIGEESPTDIGKELDRYQLELENSINEAKLQKSGATTESVLSSPSDEIKLHFMPKTKFIQKLNVIPENVENNETTEKTFILNAEKEHATNIFQGNLKPLYQKTETAEVIAIENLDELYGSDSEDSFDFISPAPFVRAYTRQATTNLTVSKESVAPSKCASSEDRNDGKKALNVKNVIRKSIRKLVNAAANPGQSEKRAADDNSNKKLEHEKQKGFMNTIRSSLRKKPAAKDPVDESDNKNEISIIDYSERTMKLKADEYMNGEDFISERTSSLRSSLRKSTREVRNQLLKSVFHKKHEAYDFRK